MNSYSKEIPGMPGTGGELAQHLLEKFEIKAGVEISEIGDHYDPQDRMVRLSQSNYDGKSLTAVAIAAHEVGHAIQHDRKETSLQLRTSLVPVANIIARVPR